MEQNSEATAATASSSNGDVEATIVLKVDSKKTAAPAETAANDNVETESSADAVATIKIQSNKQPAAETEPAVEEEEVEVEEVIVEEVEQAAESENEETKSEEKDATDSIKEAPAKTAVQSNEESKTEVSPPPQTVAKAETIEVKVASTPAAKAEVNAVSAATVVVKAKPQEKQVEEEEDEEEEEEEVSEEEVEEVEDEAEPDAVVVVTKKQEPEPAVERVKNERENEAKQQVEQTQHKQESANNAIKEIISDIDINIREQERIALLKQEELKLLKKQQELAQQIREQQLLAQKLASQNDMMQQYQQRQQKQEEITAPAIVQQYDVPKTSVSKYSTYEETKDGNIITQKTETYESEESSNATKRIDLQKIFTPATDAEEILPKNRKLYASSAFYSPSLHPTVEDQVELARRISHSLSDISNHQSKGQSMYVNRKKRSVKWVHEGQGVTALEQEYDEEQHKENAVIEDTEPKRTSLDKLPLRLLMNPRGQVRDYNSLRDSLNVETGLLSPEKCAELVTALQTHKGRGAELFAKRRKKADKWVVDEQNASTHSPSGLPDYHPYQAPPKPPTSPSILPAYSDAGKHRVQLNLHQEQVLEKYAKPGVKVVRSPWEAALETGSASTAFMEDSKQTQHSLTPTPSPALLTSYPQTTFDTYREPPAPEIQQYTAPKPSSYNDHQRDLAYKPNLAQGWKAPSVTLPKVYKEAHVYPTNDTIELLSNNNQAQSRHKLKTMPFMCYDTDKDEDPEIMSYNMCQQTPLTMLEQQMAELDHIPPLNQPNLPADNLRNNDTTTWQERSQRDSITTNNTTNISNNNTTSSSNEEPYKRVDVRKQLEQFERQHHDTVLQQIQEERLQRKREGSQQKWKWQEKQQIVQTASNGIATTASAAASQERKLDGDDAEAEYIKVAVRDLIESFEQQTIIETEKNAKELQSRTQRSQSLLDATSSQSQELVEKELYMPKEIPLESYAPPPVMNIKPASSPYQQSNTWKPSAYPEPSAAPAYESSFKPAADYASYTPLHDAPKPQAQQYGSGFPVNVGSLPKSDYTGGSGFPTGANQPPKQQYWEPTSYQKAPNTLAQKVPQVNFNPSPLSYDKLAKFENTEPQDAYRRNSPQQRYLGVNYGSKVRNTSPSPFGASPSPKLPVQQPHYQQQQQQQSYSGAGSPPYASNYSPSQQQYPTYGSDCYSSPMPSSTATSHLSANELLHGPTFNNSARGWRGGASSNLHSFPKMRAAPITTANGDMPYTDF